MNNFTKIIIIIGTLSIIVITGWTITTQTSSNKNQNQISNKNLNLSVKEEEWEIYKNQKYNYQFEHPIRIVLSPDSTDNAIVLWGNGSSDFLSVAIVNNVFSLDAWLKDNPDKIIVQKTKIANYDAYITRQDISSYNDRMAFFLKDSQLFTIGTKLPDADFNRTLNSFKFEK